RAEIREIEWFFDELNCIRPIACGSKFCRSARGDNENARVWVGGPYSAEEFDGVGQGWIEIDNEQLRRCFRGHVFSFAQRFDHAGPMPGRKFSQSGRDRRSQRV